MSANTSLNTSLKRPRLHRAGAGAGVLALLLAGCGGGGAVPGAVSGECGSPHVVVTTSILGDIVGNVVGDRGRVEVLMPVGADPHSFQPSASQAAALRQADLVVVNGLGLEEGLHDVIEAAVAEGVTVVEAALFVEPLPFAAEHEDEAHEGEEGARARQPRPAHLDRPGTHGGSGYRHRGGPGHRRPVLRRRLPRSPRRPTPRT